jgi:PAS domain S-box-containing protein
MFDTARSKWLRYGFAVASVLAALVLTFIFQVLVDPDPLSLFFLSAVILSVWFGGIGPGLVATAVSIPVMDYFLLSPTYAFSTLYPANVLWLLTFGGVALLTNSILENRNRVAKRHAEQSELLRVTLESIGDGVIATDSASKITFMNLTAATMTGWQAHEAEGQDIQQIFKITDSPTQPPIENPVAQILREGRTVGLANHTLLIARDGTKYPIDDSGAPIRNAAGDIVGVVVVFRDISAQKEAETALSESETRFRSMADTAPVLMWMSDTAKNTVFCNKGWLDFTGRTLEEELRVGWSEEIHPDDYSEAWAAFTQAFDARREYVLEYRLKRRDGAFRWMLEKGIPRYTSEGTFAGYIGSLIDIHDRKEAEAAMEESERLYRHLFENNPQPLWVFDRRSLQFLAVNDAAVQHYGYTHDEFLAMTMRDIRPPEDLPLLEKAVRDVPDQAVTKVGLFRHIKKDGSQIIVDATAHPLTFNDRPALLGLITDMTEQLRVEAERARLAASLEEQRERLKALVANVPGVVWESWGEPDASSQRINFVSDYVQTLLGYTVEEWVNTPNFWLTIVHPDDREQAAAIARAGYASKEPHINRFRWVMKDGGIIPIETQSNAIQDADGNPVGMRGISIDVSERERLEAERRQALDALRESESRLRTVLENMPVMLVAADEKNHILVWNREAERISGYSSAEVIGNANILTLLFPDENVRESLRSQWSNRTHDLRHLETNIVAKDDAVRVLDWSDISGSFPVPGWSSWLVGVDVTERKRSEERMARLQEMTANLSEALTPRQVAEVIVGKALTALGGHLGAVWQVSDDRQWVEVLNQKGFREEIIKGYYRIPIDLPGPISDTIRTHEPIWLDSYAEYAEHYPTVAPLARANGTQSSASLPLIVNGEAIGAITFSFQKPGMLDDENRAFLSALADQCAQALERARLYEAERLAREEAEAAQQRLAFIAEASTALSSSLDYETTLKSLASLAVPTLCDMCGVYIADERGELHILTITGSIPEKVDLAYQLYDHFKPDPDSPGGTYHVFRTGKPEITSEINDAMLQSIAQNEQHLALMRQIGLNSLMNVPLISRDQVLGVVTFLSSESGRQYGTLDLALATEVARRAALAVDNARLYSEAREQRERLRVILASIGDAVIATDTEGKISFMNTVAQTLTGWTQDDAQGQPLESVFRIVNETTRETVESPFTKVMREGTVVGLANHTLLLKRDGLPVPIDDSGAPIRDDQAGITGVVLVFRNITERKRLEERLRFLVDAGAVLASSLDYKTTLESVVKLAIPRFADWCIIRMPDAEGIFRAVAVAHVDADNVPLMRDMEERYPPQAGPPFGYVAALSTDKGVLRPEVTPAMLDAIAQSPEHRQLLGQFSWLSHMSVPVRVGDEIVATITFATSGDSGRTYDQRDLELAEELARRTGIAIQNARLYASEQAARERAVSILESISDAFYTLDWDWRFTYVNHKAEELWGRRREVLIGKVLWDEFPQLIDTEPYHLQLQAKVDRQPVHFETISPVLHHWIEATMYPGDSGLSVYFRDISQRKQAEAEKARLFEIEQRARQEAEEANALKLKFLAMISHELRTPLTSIKGFATTLLAQDVSFDAEYQKQFIEIIDEEADKLTELIEQLLDLSRLQAGNLRIAPNPQGVFDIMDDARAQLETLSVAHRLIARVPDDLPLVMADPVRVSQVLVNLVGNAVKYGPLETPIIISAAKQDDRVKISVSDSGPGIPPEARDYVFEAFRQVERTGAQKGAGLGLAICKGLIEAHGGDIWIDESSSGGTTISFTLPIATPDNGAEGD